MGLDLEISLILLTLDRVALLLVLSLKLLSHTAFSRMFCQII